VKVFAVIPALLVLVSLCGSPVPPPPGTVSGTVFFDANRNGLRDNCDSPMRNTQVIVYGPNGASGTAKTDERGDFKIEDAPVGDGNVTLFRSEAYIWPITTPPQPVHVEASRETTGVVIGSASRAVYDANRMSISGVVFDDKNANGLVDENECPLTLGDTNDLRVRSGARMAIIGPNGGYELRNLDDDHPQEVQAGYLEFAAVNAYPYGHAYRPVSNDPGDTVCAARYTATGRYGGKVYEANLGFTLARGSASVSGVVFDDVNGSGARDENESAVAGVWIRLHTAGGCRLYDNEWATTTDANGEFEIDGLYAATYVPSIDLNPVGDGDFVTLRSEAPEIRVDQQGSRYLKLPVKVGPPGSISILAFDDNNGNGTRDAGEDAVAGANVCVAMKSRFTSQPGPPNPYTYDPNYYANDSCWTTLTDGLVHVDRLPEGDYTVDVSSVGMPGVVMGSAPSAFEVKVTSGEATQLDVPLSVLTPEEQVIPPGVGTPFNMDICYLDPEWTAPRFEDRWKSSLRQQTGYDEATAKLAYEHPVHHMNFGEIFIWASIAGFDLPQLGDACATSLGTMYVIVGYEPVDSFGLGDQYQVRLRRSTAGVFIVHLPNLSAQEFGNVHMFVDEDYQPIVRCGSFCEWNDGTKPDYSEGGVGYGYIGP
jgi:hypothetical protein